MAYGYQPYYTPYAPYQPPMPDQLAQLRAGQYQPQLPNMQQPPQQNNTQIVWVPGGQAAFEYPVAPNSAVALWDSTAPVIYLKQADASGKPATKIYDLVERNAAAPPASPAAVAQSPAIEYATKEDLAALEARVEALSTTKTNRAKKEVTPDE
mgnify:CR=1 FL=1